MTFDLGDVATIYTKITDPTTGLPANATAVAVVVTAPDATTSTPTVTNPTTGTYQATLTLSQVGRYVAVWTATGTNAGVFVDVLEVDDTAAAGVSIVSLDDIKGHLGISQTGTDDRLRNFGLLASEVTENYTGRTWRPVSVTEKYDGGVERIRLLTTPVQSITSILEFSSPVTLFVFDPVAYTVSRGTAYGGYRWLPGTQNITITYLAGAPKIPASVRIATLELVRHLWDTMRGGYSIPKQQGMSDDWDPRQGYSIPRRVAEMLDFYKAPGF